MSHFAVRIRRIDAVAHHPKADRLDIASIGGFCAVIGRDTRVAGDLVAYIPEAAICPQYVLERMGLWDVDAGKGLCAGTKGDRIKALTLRGMLSQGLAWPLEFDGHAWMLTTSRGTLHTMHEGDDAGALLGIYKHVPEIPAELAGLVFDAGIDVMPKFDFEDVKTYPDVLVDGEEVEFTEKLHGTQIVLVRLPDSLADPEQGRYRVASKGLSGDGLAFQLCAENHGNVYVGAFVQLGLAAKLDALAAALPGAENKPVVVLAELVGSASRQDLKYGEHASVRPFEIALGTRSELVYQNRDEVQRLAALVGWPSVPVLYRGPFGAPVLQAHTTGKETLSGRSLHIREGVVIRTVPDRRDPAIGRVIFKSLNPAYVLRDGGSEHN